MDVEEAVYNEAYYLTYGKMPPTYKPLAPGQLQKLLEKIAPQGTKDK